MRFSFDHDYTMKYWKTVDERKHKNDIRREERKKKVEALLNDPATTEGEKMAAREALLRLNTV